MGGFLRGTITYTLNKGQDKAGESIGDELSSVRRAPREEKHNILKGLGGRAGF